MIVAIGLASLLAFKSIYDPTFHLMGHLFGTNPLTEQLMHKGLRQGEWGILLNLLGLLLGFEILSKVFEDTGIPGVLPNCLPNDWKGPFLLLVFVFMLSSFLDNIAAALIGGAIALVVFKHRVHIGFIVATAAAANAGGSGSVLGDTTTTMMWIDGVSSVNVLHAYVAAVVAFLFFAVVASHQQDRYQPIQANASAGLKLIGAGYSSFLLGCISAIF